MALYLTRHKTPGGNCWAVDNHLLPARITLDSLLAMPADVMRATLEGMPQGERIDGAPLAPVEPDQEVWGSGVTYLRSREARKAESTQADVYQRVYDAPRPEIFFKSTGWRVVAGGDAVRIRKDTKWNVPEPELTLVINAYGEVVGYTIGNDMSSRDIEGENPLYLPQAKTYNGSCALGPGILVANADEMVGLTIEMQIERGGNIVFAGDTSTDNMKRTFPELAEYLYRELSFPGGALLMTGTGIVPPDDFTLAEGDVIRISIGGHTLENPVA